MIVSDVAGLGFAASVYSDAWHGVKGAHGADIGSMGAMKYHALYRWAPGFASWMHERRVMDRLVVNYIVPVLGKVRGLSPQAVR